MTVAFDESGNTGQNLFDADSPVFALASCHFDPRQVIELSNCFTQIQAPELKFAKMVGRSRNEQMVLKFLESPHINSGTVKIDIVHKRFMVVAKFVDLFVEPSMRRSGLDLYKGAGNVATANLLHIVAPVFLNPVTWNNFLTHFANMVWKRDVAAWSKFLITTELICNQLEFTRPNFAGFFLSVLQWRGRFKQFLESVSVDELDPIPPSYALLANAWGKQLGRPFDVLADESKVLATYKPVLMKLSDPMVKPARAGYNSRTMDYPLRVSSITPVASESSKEVQFADILAGAACCFLKSQNRANQNTFEGKIDAQMVAKGLIPNMLWPDTKVTPKELNAAGDEAGQVNLNEYAARILSDHPATKKSVS
jgi:hypothetical protein